MLDDTFDVDLNGNTSEDTPDRDLETRIVNSVVDMGAYEADTIDVCAGDTNADGAVNVTDLLNVINAWGSCASCPEDIAPATPCPDPDGQVDVQDLLLVINTWGDCASGGSPFPASLSACYSEYCNGLSGSEYTECIEKCTEGYCSQSPTPEDCE